MPGPSSVEILGLRLIGSEPQAGEEAGSREVEAMVECRTTTVGGQGVGALSRTTDVGGQVVGAPSRTTTVGGQVVGAQKVDDEVDAGTSFVLSDGLPPVPAKLVRKIVRGEFVDMAELLRDNLEADRRDAGTLSSEGGGVRRTGSRREVPDLLSWVQCFGVYIGVVASRQPEKVKQLLAYQTLIIREARRLGGRGWLAYDSMFRQQAAVSQSTDWSKLNSTLYAVTFLAQQGGKVRSCVYCLESDHVEEDCSLAPKQQSLGGKRENVYNTPANRDQAAAPPSRQRQVCFAWNEGRCQYPYCRFRHVCIRCQGDHRVTQCRQQSVQSHRGSGGSGR